MWECVSNHGLSFSLPHFFFSIPDRQITSLFPSKIKQVDQSPFFIWICKRNWSFSIAFFIYLFAVRESSWVDVELEAKGASIADIQLRAFFLSTYRNKSCAKSSFVGWMISLTSLSTLFPCTLAISFTSNCFPFRFSLIAVVILWSPCGILNKKLYLYSIVERFSNFSGIGPLFRRPFNCLF